MPDIRIPVSEQMSVVQGNANAWMQLQPLSGSEPESDSSAVFAFPTLTSALSWVGRDGAPLEPGVTAYRSLGHDTHLQVFVTGSLYLVGNALAVLRVQI